MTAILHDFVCTQFRQHFCENPALTVQAPARVNIIGEHTDYNEGFVLPCAIDFQTVIGISPRSDNAVHVVAADYGGEHDVFALSQNIPHHEKYLWANYVRGVVQYLYRKTTMEKFPDRVVDRFSDRNCDQIKNPECVEDSIKSQTILRGANLCISGNVPQGSGLSSSASLEVAVCTAFNALYDLHISQVEMALLSQMAENRFVGCNCGIMDQLISARGEKGCALLLDCRSLETQSVTVPDDVMVMIINSNVKRGLVDSKYNERRLQCEAAAHFFNMKSLRDVTPDMLDKAYGIDSLLFRRARHVISENQRTLDMVKALKERDMMAVSHLMRRSHISMRDDFEITHPAIDYLFDIISNVIGSEGGVRMTGGGFGGCVIALIPQDKVSEVIHDIDEKYLPHTGLSAAFYLCSPQEGAGLLKKFG